MNFRIFFVLAVIGFSAIAQDDPEILLWEEALPLRTGSVLIENANANETVEVLADPECLLAELNAFFMGEDGYLLPYLDPNYSGEVFHYGEGIIYVVLPSVLEPSDFLKELIREKVAAKEKACIASRGHWDPEAGLLRISPAPLPPSLPLPELLESSRRIEWRVNDVRDRLETFKTERLSPFESIRVQANTRLIYFQLTPENVEELDRVLEIYDTKPYGITVQVKLLSVNDNTLEKLGTLVTYANDSDDPDVSAIIDLSEGSPAVFEALLGDMDDVFSIVTDVIVENGHGSQQRLPDFSLLEYYGEDQAPSVFKKVERIPQINTFEQGSYSEMIESGLTLNFSHVRVIETQAYRDEVTEIQAEMETWARENAHLLEFSAEVQSLTESPRGDLFLLSWPDRTQYFDYFRALDQKEALDRRMRMAKRHLEIRIRVSIEDGGVTQTITTENYVAPLTESRIVETELVLRNNRPSFVAGTNEVSRVSTERKVPILGDAPGIGTLFRSDTEQENQNSVVTFITASVQDEKSDLYTAAEYSLQGQRFAIPMSLGGYANDSILTHPLTTGIRSRLKWMYSNQSVFIRAKRKIVNGIREGMGYDSPEAIDFVSTWISRSFYFRILAPFGILDVTQDQDWYDFSVIRATLDHLNGGTGGRGVVYELQAIQGEVKGMTGIELSLSEIIAIVRHEGRIGRGEDPEESDERLTLYLAALVAKHAGETGDDDPFNYPGDLENFWKYFWKLEEPDKWQKQVGYYLMED